jgi:hypothetical protein
VYAAEMDGKRLTFEVYGVWRKNMVIRDRESGTIWQQATGEGLDGLYKGRHLEVIFSQEMNWGALRKFQPKAQYALAPEKHRGIIPLRILNHMLATITPRGQLSGLSGADRRLDGHETVVGVVVNGEARAYPLKTLKSQTCVRDRAGGLDIVLEYRAQSDQVVVRDGDGNILRHERQWWLGWSEFHPRSGVYQ